jgi:hypothetical protein
VVNAKFRFEAVFARQFDVLLVHGLAVRLFRGGPFLFAFVLLISIALLVWHEFSFPHGVRVPSWSCADLLRPSVVWARAVVGGACTV